jgi:hypothetical protein
MCIERHKKNWLDGRQTDCVRNNVRNINLKNCGGCGKSNQLSSPQFLDSHINEKINEESKKKAKTAH